LEIHEEDQRVIEKLTHQLEVAKRENMQLRITIKKK
jgi:hypothetical protein